MIEYRKDAMKGNGSLKSIMEKKTKQIGALCLAAMLLCSCSLWEPIETQPTGGTLESSSQSRLDSDTAGNTVSQTDSKEDPKINAEQLSALLEQTETALPKSPAFYEWCSEYTENADLTEKLYTEFEANGFSEAAWYRLTGMTVKAANDLYSGKAFSEPNIHVMESNGQNGISFTFGGDISLADNWKVMEYLKTTANGITDCISPFLIQEMQQADLTVLNNEFCFSDRGSPMVGKSFTFRGAPENVSIYHTLGVDIVDLANNHVYDYGEDAFYDTLDTLTAAGIEYMGAGRTIREASRPVYYIIEGKKIAFVAATRAEKFVLTPEAGETTPGVLRCYDPEAFLAVIREAEEQADFVIANVHWGTENSHALESVQPETAYRYIDAGADLIIGTHAHCLQGIEYYNNVPIVYNLGNYWFSHYDIDTGLLGVTLFPDDSLELVFHPATQRNCRTTYVGGEAEGDRILQCMRDYSINVQIDENGVITEKSQ